MTEPIEQQLFQIANEAVYVKADVIRFLLVENLALKTLLHEKGLITVEEHKRHKEQATKLLEDSMKEKVKTELRQVFNKLQKNSESPAK